jgi:signal transduction histidine kinase
MINTEGARQQEEETNVAGSRKRSRGAAADSSSAPIDTRFTSLLVHDLRTPLNVIGLSLRLIEQALPSDDPDVAEDLRFIDENFHVLERMLAQLGDYARLFEPGLNLVVCEFSPWRLGDALLENRPSRAAGKQAPVQLEVQKTCPAMVLLDQGRARLALEYALANASAAASADPIRLLMRGAPERWIIEIIVDRPPPGSVESSDLDSRSFERLCGSAAERRGMDLAIAARVSELFGGTARLQAVEGQGTSIILDWPARYSGPAKI